MIAKGLVPSVESEQPHRPSDFLSNFREGDALLEHVGWDGQIVNASVAIGTDLVFHGVVDSDFSEVFWDWPFDLFIGAGIEARKGRRRAGAGGAAFGCAG